MQLLKAKETLKSCKQIVDCLIENVLNTEANTSSPQAYKRLVASFSTLYLLSKIKPENFTRHAETMLPYLNIRSTNQNDNQIINSAAKILECVVPLLQSPSNSFLLSLEESLCKLIFQGGMMVSSSFILSAVYRQRTGLRIKNKWFFKQEHFIKISHKNFFVNSTMFYCFMYFSKFYYKTACVNIPRCFLNCLI